MTTRRFVPARQIATESTKTSSLRNQRAQGMPGATRAPIDSREKKNTQAFATGSPETFRHSLRDGFTVSFVLFPEIGLVVSVISAMRQASSQT